MLDIFLWIIMIYGMYRLIVDILELKDVLDNKTKIVIRVSKINDSLIKSIIYILEHEPDVIIRIEDIGLENENHKILDNIKNKYNNLEVLKL